MVSLHASALTAVKFKATALRLI